MNAILIQFQCSPNGKWIWLTEVDSPNGIADLTAVRIAAQTSAFSDLAAIPARWAYALSSLTKDNPVTVDEFARLTNSSRACALAVLRTYQMAGYCAVTNAGAPYWTKKREPALIADKIIAVEAKLRDWRRALLQAFRYCDYASESWVVMDTQGIDAAEAHLEDFQLRGVGLAGMNTDGILTVYSQPHCRHPRSLHRQWQVNAYIAGRLAGRGAHEAAVVGVNTV